MQVGCLSGSLALAVSIRTFDDAMYKLTPLYHLCSLHGVALASKLNEFSGMQEEKNECRILEASERR